MTSFVYQFSIMSLIRSKKLLIVQYVVQYFLQHSSVWGELVCLPGEF